MVNLKFDDIRKLQNRLSPPEELQQVILNAGSRAETLKNFDQIITDLHRKSALDPVLLGHLLQFGTIFRRSNSTELLLIVSGVYNALRLELDGSDVLGLSPRLNWIVFEGVRRCISFEDFRGLGDSLVWGDEKREIETFLKNSRSVEKEEVIQFFKRYREKFDIFFSSGKIGSIFKEDIEKLWRLLTKGDEQQRSIAGNALFYLVEDNDIVPDNLGLFGMTDDLEVLRMTMNRLMPQNVSKRILREVSGIDNSIHSLLIERGSADELQTLPLLAMSEPMQLLVGSTRYLLAEGKKKILLVLPDKGIAVLPLICSFLLDYRYREVQQPSWLEETDKEIFFDLKNLSVAVRYQGPAFSEGERIEGRVKIGNSKKYRKDNFSVTIPEQALEFASLEPRYPNNIQGNAQLISKWLLKERAFVPPHIHFTNKLEKHFCLLTRKANFQSAISAFRPFGLELRELINFHYFKSAKESELFYNRRLPGNAPDVDVFANPGVLAERLSHMSSTGSDSEEVFIFIDEEALAIEFLGMVSIDSPMFSKIYMILLADASKGWFQRECNGLGFETFALHGHIQNLSEVPNRRPKIDFSDAMSSYEKKLERSLSPARWKRVGVKSDAMDEYMRLLREISRKALVDDLPISKPALFKFQRLQKNLSQCWFPRSSEQFEKIQVEFDDVTQQLNYDALLAPEIGQLLEVLRERKDELLDIPSQRGVLNFLRKREKNQYYLLEEYETEASRSRSYVMENEIDNVEILSLSNLRGKYLERPVIIPFLFSTSAVDVLSSASSASELRLFFSDFEYGVFEQRKKRADRGTQRLIRATKKSFSGTFLEGSFSEFVTDSDETGASVPEADDNIRNLLKTYASKFSTSSTRDVAEAIPVFVKGGSEMVLLAPGANLITLDEGGSFTLNKTSQLTSGQLIFMRRGGGGDFLDEAAKYTNPHYNETKSIATIWKDELKELLSSSFSDNFSRMTKYLGENGVSREEATVKNWLNDTSLIAPRSPSDTIRKFAKMKVSKAMKDSVERIIEAIYLTYEMRRGASEVILEQLNSQTKLNGGESSFSIAFGNERLEFFVETVDAIGTQVTTPIANIGVMRQVE